MSDSTALLRTPLYETIQASGARMVPFAGWEMPVQFSGLMQEHGAVRSGVGLFDISHMGKFVLTGADCLAQLQRLIPTDINELAVGKAQYSVLLNDQGGIIDDLIIYNQGRKAAQAEGQLTVPMIVNASTKEKDKQWLLDHFEGDVQLEDRSDSHALLAVQGPRAVEFLQLLCDRDLNGIGRFGHLEAQIAGHDAFLARTGYTGEDGFEVMVSAAAGIELWNLLIEKGAVPCGLGARDTLRLEAAMALYGNDIDDSTSPLEAGLGWLVHLDKQGDFTARSILESQKQAGVTRRLVGIEMEGRNIARHGYPVVQNGETVGEVTSGTWSPTLEKAIALAYVPIELSKIGSPIQVQIRKKVCAGTVVKRPFYKAG
ncbi:MAG: glycine cleavage system aminomethyltransferase GcvT [Synechococcales cyanobacterium RM1_1_8]|nr:glycine cleavage system aminomethyltransferase GcvT [Synechococcales cyanobacterium RM1_1_8]